MIKIRLPCIITTFIDRIECISDQILAIFLLNFAGREGGILTFRFIHKLNFSSIVMRYYYRQNLNFSFIVLSLCPWNFARLCWLVQDALRRTSYNIPYFTYIIRGKFIIPLPINHQTQLWIHFRKVLTNINTFYNKVHSTKVALDDIMLLRDLIHLSYRTWRLYDGIAEEGGLESI